MRDNAGMALILKPGYEIGRQIADDPVVWVIDDFVSIEEREHIISMAADRLDEAKVSKLGENKPSEKRTGRVAWVKHNETAIVRGLVKRVSDLVGIPTLHAESLQVVHYGVTQEYQPHYDGWDIDTPKGKEKTRRGGNRAVTALMYLNEVDGGGGTCFPKVDVEVEAIPGRLCIFHDIADGERTRHINALHGGMPVTEGEKWACNLWFREKPYQQIASSRTSGGGRSKPAAKKRKR